MPTATPELEPEEKPSEPDPYTKLRDSLPPRIRPEGEDPTKIHEDGFPIDEDEFHRQVAALVASISPDDLHLYYRMSFNYVYNLFFDWNLTLNEADKWDEDGKPEVSFVECLARQADYQNFIHDPRLELPLDEENVLFTLILNYFIVEGELPEIILTPDQASVIDEMFDTYLVPEKRVGMERGSKNRKKQPQADHVAEVQITDGNGSPVTTLRGIKLTVRDNFAPDYEDQMMVTRALLAAAQIPDSDQEVASPIMDVHVLTATELAQIRKIEIVAAYTDTTSVKGSPAPKSPQK